MIKAMSVAEFIALLQTFPPDLSVVYRRYSEQVLLEADEIVIKQLCEPRPDGWVHDARPDRPTRPYLVLPGN